MKVNRTKVFPVIVFVKMFVITFLTVAGSLEAGQKRVVAVWEISERKKDGAWRLVLAKSR